MCILRNENDPTTKLLEKLNLNYEVVKDQFKELISETNDDFEDISASSTYDEEEEKEDESIEQNPLLLNLDHQSLKI